jgi:hypothetical protein
MEAGEMSYGNIGGAGVESAQKERRDEQAEKPGMPKRVNGYQGDTMQLVAAYAQRVNWFGESSRHNEQEYPGQVVVRDEGDLEVTARSAAEERAAQNESAVRSGGYNVFGAGGDFYARMH